MKLYGSLSESGQETLFSFAEFLASKPENGVSQPIPEPKLVPRPESESVVRAIKRLSASYSMLDSPKLLNETSTLMTQHVMQGRDLKLVIDDLEELFRRQYEVMIAEAAKE